MNKFTLKIPLEFPFFKMEELVKYSKVKKPSGVAYILLVLIAESKNKNNKLVQVLENFGVPKPLHFIFAEELQKIIDKKILKEALKDLNYNKNYFDEYLISDFVFTEEGKKIFNEELITTGEKKEEKISVFYNIALNQLSLEIDRNLELKPLKKSYIHSEFMNKFKCEKNIEIFLNLEKGKGINIKKEEIITNIDEIRLEKWVRNYYFDFSIDYDDIKINFDNPTIKKFFEANYKKDMIDLAILSNKELEIKPPFKQELKLSRYPEEKITEILAPKKIDNILKQKYKLCLTKGNYNEFIGDNITCPKCIDDYNDNIEFIQVDYNDLIFAYIIGFFNFKNDIFKTIKIPLIIKIKLTKNEFKEIIKPYVLSLSEYSESNFTNLINITNITNDLELAKHNIRGYVNKDPLSNIILLNEIYPYVKTNQDILIEYKELLKKNYNDYINTIKEDSLERALKITASIPSILNISQKDVLFKIFNVLKKVENVIKVYEILVAKGFDKSLVLLYVNPVKETLKIKNASEKSLINLINYDNQLLEMKKLTNIKEYKNYVYKEEINNKQFKQVFNMAFELKKNIEIFRKNNELLFLEYDNFMKIFSDINDNINLLESIHNNPNNLKFELVENKIIKGEFQQVFVILSVKLETILKNKYKLNGNLYDMLNKANLENKIEKTIIEDLHNFRNNRNAIIHSKREILNLNIEDLKRWNKEIFELEAKNK